MTIDEAVTQALASANGLALTLADVRAAIRFRADFYALRERKRRVGDTTWDGLAVAIPPRPGNELHLIKKSSTPSVQASRRHAISDTFPLTAAHLPRALRSRGCANRHWLAAEILARQSGR